MAAAIFPDAKKECSEFLRHKNYLINPLIVKQKGITVHKCVQYPGEFVITFCGSYHAGFNMGYNCAEAVNFALKRWIEVGKNAGICKCHSDSVKIDMRSFTSNLDKKKPASSKESSPVKSTSSSATKRKEKKEEPVKKVDNWLKCDSCKKWRKIPLSKLKFNF
jgi:ribosomal protein L44E